MTSSPTVLLVAAVLFLVITLSASSFVRLTYGDCYSQSKSRWPIYDSTGTDCESAGKSLGWTGTDNIKSGIISNTVRGCSTIAATGVTEGENMYENWEENSFTCGDSIKSTIFGTVQSICACFVGPACDDAMSTGTSAKSDCMCTPDRADRDSNGQVFGSNKICHAGSYCYQQMNKLGIDYHTGTTCKKTLYPKCVYTDGTSENVGSCLCGSRANYVICTSNNGLYCKESSFPPTCSNEADGGGGSSTGTGGGSSTGTDDSSMVTFVFVALLGLFCCVVYKKKAQGRNSEQAENTIPLVNEAAVPVASIPVASVPAEPRVCNHPGYWDVFISHTQRNPVAIGMLLLALCLFFHFNCWSQYTICVRTLLIFFPLFPPSCHFFVTIGLAEKMKNWLKEKGLTVWLDVCMTDRSEAAMKEGVKNSRCVIAIITGPHCDQNVIREHRASFSDYAENNSYFRRDFCLKELRWAKAFDVHIQPVMDIDDKKNVGEFLGQAPEDLKFLGGTDWIDLNRSQFMSLFFCTYSAIFYLIRVSFCLFVLIFLGDNEYWDVGMNKVYRAIPPSPRKGMNKVLRAVSPRNVSHCAKGHPMTASSARRQSNSFCDMCKDRNRAAIYVCSAGCNYDLCEPCAINQVA